MPSSRPRWSLVPADPIATALLPSVLVCARQEAASPLAVRAGLAAAAGCVACAAVGGAASVMPWMALSLLISSMSW